MADGKTLSIEVSDTEFLAKSQDEQNLLIFRVASCHEQALKANEKALRALSARITKIDNNGCAMAKKRKLYTPATKKKRTVFKIGGITIGGSVLLALIELIKSLLSN